MTETPPAAARDERPAPIVLHDGIVVPGVLCAELAAALEEYVGLLRGAPLPAARRGTTLSRPVVAVLLASRDAAARHQAQQHALRAWAAPTAGTPVVLGTAQLAEESGAQELITTSEAAELAGFSPEWWRRLAVRGTVRGRQVERRTWLLNRQDVIAYVHRADQETPRGHSDPHPARPARQAG